MSAAARTEHLVTPADLRETLDSTSAPVLLDVRWHLADATGDGRRRYEAAHLPGARFLDLETVLTGHTDDPRDGRHPLPDAATLTSGLARLGVEAGSDVVVYDEPGSYAAERAWWVLRWAGVRARILDGGIRAWTEAGMPVESGPPRQPVASPSPAPALTTGRLATLDADGAAALPGQGVLVDARAAERFRGEVEPLDPRAGHIPGAVNAPAVALFSADGRLPDDETIHILLDVALGGGSGEPLDTPPPGSPAAAPPPVAVYCGSGVSAARVVLALAVLDVDAALFPGSWSAWSNDPGRPVATGPELGAAHHVAGSPDLLALRSLGTPPVDNRGPEGGSRAD